MKRVRNLAFSAMAAVGGAVLGMVVWGSPIERCRRDLFSRSRVKRLAALGYLNGRPSLYTARLLDEYVQWEKQPVLRRRGERMLRRMSAYLD